MDTLKKNKGNKYKHWFLQIKTKKYSQNIQYFRIKLRIWLKQKNGNLGDYEKDFMKIKFDSDHGLPLNKLLSFIT